MKYEVANKTSLASIHNTDFQTKKRLLQIKQVWHLFTTNVLSILQRVANKTSLASIHNMGGETIRSVEVANKTSLASIHNSFFSFFSQFVANKTSLASIHNLLFCVIRPPVANKTSLASIHNRCSGGRHYGLQIKQVWHLFTTESTLWRGGGCK